MDAATASPVWDLHAHIVPATLVDAMRGGRAADGVHTVVSEGQEYTVHGGGKRHPLPPEVRDVEARLARMDDAGVDIAVVSLSPTLLMYWVGAEEAVEHARLVNDGIAAAVAEAPDRLVGCAHVPMQDPDAAVAEVQRVTGELGLRGVQIAPMVLDRSLDEEDLVPVLAAVERAGVPATLHPYFIGAGARPGLDRYFLTNLVGHPYQTAVGASRLIMSGVLDQLPDLELVLVHGGGYLPYQVGRLDHGYRVRPEARACRSLPSTYLRRFTFDTLTHSAASMRFLIDLVGADRVAYGTDFPYDMGGGSPAEQLDGVDLAAPERIAIVGGNAAHLYSADRPLSSETAS
jgi:aminocarboxymuconate-semialdehyde decarboxylase